MTKKELNRLKKNLPKGYREKLAAQFKCSMGHIDNVLNGERNNFEILKAALELAKEHKRELEEFALQVKTL